MAFKLPPLPYKLSELEPHISERTLEFHYHKHHQGYVDKLNELLTAAHREETNLEAVIQKAFNNPDQRAIFNNAAQVWNHTFYWNSMTSESKGGGEPAEGPLKKALLQQFGSVDGFKAEFKKAALGQFGSGWAWLVYSSQGRLDIMTTGNAELPSLQKEKPLLTCDVWEHAYYLDYQNRRPAYVDVFLNSLVNWEFAEENMK